MTAAKSIYLNKEKAGWWYFSNGELIIQFNLGAGGNGLWSQVFCFFNYNKYLIEHSSSNLIYGDKEGNEWYFKSCSSPVPDNSESTSGSSYEKPDISFYDFTAYQTKLKVVYKIYNKDEGKGDFCKGLLRNKFQSDKVCHSNSLRCPYHSQHIWFEERYNLLR